MRTKRIELEGSHGSVAIERPRNSTTIRIDSIVANPTKGQQAWKTWEIEASGAYDSEVWEIASVIQCRCDGCLGTQGDIDGYFRELQRFQD